MRYNILSSQSGLSIIAIVLLMLMLALFAAVGVSIITTGTGVGIQEEQGMQAFYIAEGGLEKAAFRFKNGTTCTSLNETNTTLGQGTFSISDATSYTLSNTLSAGIDAAVTTIPVTSEAGFPLKGRITIESEKIDYYGKSQSPDNLLYAVRGAAGTTAAAHLISVPVSQNQCGIKSTGKITTNPLIATIQRVVEKYLQSAAADDCTTCHAAVVPAPLCGGGCAGGTRRAMMSEFGSQWSHKKSAGGAVTKYDCGVCHMEGSPTTGATVSPYHEATAGNGYLELRSPKVDARIKTVTFSEPPTNEYSSTVTDLVIKQFSRDLGSATLEEGVKAIEINLCLGCHDGVGAVSSASWVTGGSALNPFASGGTPTNIKTEFDKGNSSYHPVRSRQKSYYIDINTMEAPSTKSAWNQFAKAKTTETPIKTAGTVSGETGWTNATVAYLGASDDQRATHAGSTTQPKIIATNFGFATTEYILGVTVTVEGQSAANSGRDIQVGLTTNGTTLAGSYEPSQAFAKNTDVPTLIFGGASNLWGAALTSALVNGANFGVFIRDANTASTDLKIDQVTVKVTYTAPATYGDLISCWDCHAPSGATGVQSSTVDAHGSGAATETLRGTIYDPLTNTLCVICHKQTIYVLAGGGNHGAGSAYVTPSDAQMKPTAAYQQRCNLCHGSNINLPARPIPSQDVHGFNSLVAGGNWPQYGNRPYTFIRNPSEFQNHRPKRSPENATGNAGCNLAVGAGGGYCANASMPTTPGDTSATYSPGGVY